MTAGAPPCPICNEPAASAAYRPFCSKRCADIDLGRWMTGRYAIPATEDDAGDEGDMRGDAAGLDDDDDTVTPR